MERPSKVLIRKFSNKDRDAVRKISYETAFIGMPGSAFFYDEEVLSDALTLYFTDYEPESCFVAEYENTVIGYLLVSKDIARMDMVFARRIRLPLLLKALRRGVFWKKKNILFLVHVFVSLLKGDFKSPSFVKEYPATLHINIKSGYRGLGIGAALISKGLQNLLFERVTGVHFATLSESAAAFFRKQDFKLLFQGRRSYFYYILHREVPIYIFGTRIQGK